MATKISIWRTKPSGIEGVTTVYVDGNNGSDEYGDGTRLKPYQTINEAYYHNTTKPTTIVCRGPISGTIIGNRNVAIVGDYFGAAWYDGEGKNILMWCGSVSNMIIINAGDEIDAESMRSFYPLGYEGYKDAPFAGCGRANNDYFVNGANYGYGLASGSVLVLNSKMWRGQIGGSGTSSTVYSHIVKNCSICRVTLGTYSTSYLNNCTAHNCKFVTGDRTRRKKQTSVNTLQFRGAKWLFSNFDIFVDDNSIDYYLNCFFDRDCNFIFEYSGKNYRITIGDASAAKSHVLGDVPVESGEYSLYEVVVNGVEDIPSAISYLRTASLITVSTVPQFSGCVWSQQTEHDLFVDSDHWNFALVHDCDAVDQLNFNYYGAMPPALRISIHENSDGHLFCWDSRTKDGCIGVENGTISADETVTSGQILTKVMKLNQHVMQINGFYAPIESKKDLGISMSLEDVFGDVYMPGDSLPIGWYKVLGVGSIEYEDTESGKSVLHPAEDTIYVTEEDTSFQNAVDSDCYLAYIIDPNVMDTIYVRCRQEIYAYAAEGTPLVKGVTYLNEGETPVLYRGRTIVPGESFVADDNSTFTSLSGAASLSIVFDDRDVSDSERLVPSAPWITPAQLFGNYFVSKRSGEIDLDPETNKYAQSSGNYRVWKSEGNGSYVISGTANIINQPYVQFALFVKRV